MRRFAASIVGKLLSLFAQILTAVRADWRGIEPVAKQRVYYANHTSNADLPLIWAVLPAAIRRDTRAVAAADYWLKNKLRAFIGRDVFQGVMVDRRAEHRTEDPIAKIVQALDEGSSIIIFPEGGRNRSEDPLMPFKSGLYNIAKERPEVDLVPCWIDNISHIMPTGEVIPVPLACTVIFGAPVHVKEGEEIGPFLQRASDALLELIPNRGSA
ncbi:1-acyl-sn-glycerol-3-phosphate acyltransferase [Litoreibacter ponti]|uniref:1-acyl-sn-glycerol-3-phosphate acyltransferase n=1 Tax=Litoreibacter ponti TaxID=1510457 RepID=A0A2T6BFD9_9RHOB|nr:lysophospholipid acyltransferase family protein [Litoreibacter ponti]PTX54782.1 1-acyl-sn-glycerol-3-phosphate acyltransferase [Litoreibacter ponti]